MAPKFTSWSPSRLADYDACPLMAKLKHLDKLCPLCFDGKVMGGYDSPAICDSCGEEIKKGDALERGTEIGKNLELYVNGEVSKLHPEIKHPKVMKIAKDLRGLFKKGRVKVEHMASLSNTWKLMDPTDWRNIWLRAKLDVLDVDGKKAKVIDWKTGGIDKRNGSVRANDKYDSQLDLYNVATLCAFPEVEEVESALVFVDCGKAHDPVVERGSLKRADLKEAQKEWVKRVRAMFHDTSFVPTPGNCRFCDFRKDKGGPCRF